MVVSFCLPSVKKLDKNATDIAGMVAAMTEDELGVASEKSSHNTLGWPGQQYEVGKLFGGSVGCRRAFTWFVAEQPCQR
jgi:hypothetical protein